MILDPWFPFPTTWPYPPYPYPPGSYPWPYPDDGGDAAPSGPTVPDDLPTAQAPAPAYWYYCDSPDGYYPYVKSCAHTWNLIPISPPPPGASRPISYSDWLWCEDSKSFFPYVSYCHSGFVSMPVTAPHAENAGPPAVAQWFYCEDPKGYLPYVMQCKKDWRAVPAVPPPSVKITVKDGKK